jgi:hypothetical protein
MNINGKTILVIVFLVLYAFVNIQTLTAFPNVHSDELWLKGLTEEMVTSGSFQVTEPFYNLYPRVVHPFRWLYHSIQAGIYFVLGGTVFAMRFVSLIGGLLSLVIFYKLAQNRFNCKWTALTLSALLSLNIQFIASAHTGRQETWVLFFMLLNIYLIQSKKLNPIAYGIVILLGMGIHPNSFLIGMTSAALMTSQILMRERPLKDLMKLIGFTIGGVIVYLIVGLSWNPEIISKYFEFGSSLGVDAPPLSRLEGFYWFWYKLFHRIGGTYDLYNIKPELILIGISLLGMPYLLFRNKRDNFGSALNQLAIITALGIGIFIIGRYNQTSVVFIMPFLILLISEYIEPFTRKRFWIPLLLIAVASFHLYSNVDQYYSEMPYYRSYEDVIKDIQSHVPKEARVLGNLNMITAFENRNFIDVRNLGFLVDNGHDFESFVRTNAIEYILIHDEMDYLAKTSPKWDFLYVDISYYQDMIEFLDTSTTLVGTVDNPVYAMRITRYAGTFPWQTKIYRINSN